MQHEDQLLAGVIADAIGPAMAMLPPRMDTPQARLMLLAIALQESGCTDRCQAGGGPARGLWQFEAGGGVYGVLMHPAVRAITVSVCDDRGCAPIKRELWAGLERDDVLAAACARLLLFTDPRPLPAIGDEQAAWDCYERTWRPGKPHRERWGANYSRARAALGL